ncbi:hypothetical protein SGLAM104S_01590 [Streptomyces glaucescens]
MATSDEVHMGVSEARANLTEVIAKVRLLGQRVVLTRRDKPQAVLISADYYANFEQDALIGRALRRVPDQAERERIMDVLEPYLDSDTKF